MHKQVWSLTWQEEMVPAFLCAVQLGEAFHGLGVQDVEGLILVGAFFPLN
jgi:hypothetical protein